MKNKDKNLQKAIDDLPKYEPKDDLWNNIEAALDKQQTNVGHAKADKAVKPKILFGFAAWQGKTKAKFAMAASVLLAAIGGTWLYQNSKNHTSSDVELLADIQKVSDVKPVFSNTDVAFKHLVVKTEVGANFKLPNGTKIQVPQDAFVDKNNKPIVGNVDLEYREFHNAAQILASGIPMTYDSAGVTHQFESAGMFEIRGFQDNEPIFIAKNKGINVDMASFVKGDDFRFYYLDQTNTKNNVAYNVPFFTQAHAQTTTKNDTTDFAARAGNTSGYWKYLGINKSKNNEDKISKIDSAVEMFSQEYLANIAAEKAAIASEKAAENAKMAMENIVLNRKNSRAIRAENFFRLRFDIEKYPELEPFESMVWEYTGEKNENKNPRSAKNFWIAEKKWRAMELTQKLFQPIALTGHPGDVNDAEFSPDGKFIVTAAGGGAKLWDKNGKLLHDLDGHPDIVKQADFSSDSKLILTVAGGLVNLWNTEGKLLQTFGNNPDIISSAIFADNNTKVIVSTGGHTKIWNVKGNLIADIKSGDKETVGDFIKQTNTVTNNFVNENQDYVCKTDGGNHIYILKPDVAESFYSRRRNVSTLSDVAYKILKNAHQNTILKTNFSPDGKFLISSSKDNTIKVWSVAEDFKLVTSMKMQELSRIPATLVAVAPDNQAILSIGNNPRNKNVFKDDAVYLWKRITPKDANIYELTVYCKPETKGEIEDFGDNISFSTTIYREQDEQQTQTSSQKLNPMLAKRIQNLDQIIGQYEKALAERRKVEEVRLANEANLLRNYPVQNFGIHNWDRPFERENLLSITASFELDSAITKTITQHNNVQIFFVTGENNTVVQRLSLKGKSYLRFPKTNVANQFVAVLPNNQVAIFSAEEFKDLVLSKSEFVAEKSQTLQQTVLKLKESDFTFKFNTIKPVNVVDDLQAYLKVKS
jgi:WD40 repeat protein